MNSTTDFTKNLLQESDQLYREYLKLSLDGNDFLLKNNLILVKSGSIVYGANLDNSDHDYKGLVIASKEYLFGLEEFTKVDNYSSKNEKSDSSSVDLELYELKNFVKGYLKGNVHIIQMFTTPKEHIVYEHPLFAELKAELFSKRSKYICNLFEITAKRLWNTAKRNYDKENYDEAYKNMYQAINILKLGQKYLTLEDYTTYDEEFSKYLLSIRKGYFKTFEDFDKEFLSSFATSQELLAKSNYTDSINYVEVTSILKKIYSEYLF